MTKNLPALARKYGAQFAAGGTALMLAASNALAAAPAVPDVGDGAACIEGLLAPIGVLGAAFLIVSIAIKGWKIMRAV